MYSMEANLSEELFKHFGYVRSGSQHHLYRAPEGLNRDDRERLENSGIDVVRSWSRLPNIPPTWRNEPKLSYSKKAARGSRKVLEAIEAKTLRGIAYFDVDHAIMGRDAQLDVDKKALALSSLEAIGFVATHYVELLDRSNHLSVIRSRSNPQADKNLGRELFHLALLNIAENARNFIIHEMSSEFLKIAKKSAQDLTEQDFVMALACIEDALYKLVIDPLMTYTTPENQDLTYTDDIQSGEDRMTIIYKMIAALSHVASDEHIKINLKNFFDFDFNEHAYEGAIDYIAALQNCGVRTPAITRGNHLPFMLENNNGLSGKFDAVYATLLWAERNPEKKYGGKFDEAKKIRPYSTVIVKISTTDKLKIMFHEAIEKLNAAGVELDHPTELLGGIATYFDHCMVTTDTDDELRGTAPTTEVTALRNASIASRIKLYGVNYPLPVLILNPKGLESPLAQHNIPEISSYSQEHPEIRAILDNFENGRPQTELVLS